MRRPIFHVEIVQKIPDGASGALYSTAYTVVLLLLLSLHDEWIMIIFLIMQNIPTNVALMLVHDCYSLPSIPLK